ncbi:MAG: cohesin domain-containing protein [Candidatus Eisenbacteria bacterium]|uniref:Cohesin domain-containing protein n=1 Tax=Eiseniibacteriota bacterium TaxID=2212470 RepID=A0A956LZT0_UNCEI|nr:hypothetical protein [Candidatus Eisenbacteria bacterium]
MRGYWLAALIGGAMSIGCGGGDDVTRPEDESLEISLSPAAVEVPQGRVFDLEVRIANAVDVFSASFEVQLPDLFTVAAPVASKGDFPSGDALFLAVSEPGKISIGFTEVQTGERRGRSGSGTLAVLHLIARRSGESTLAVSGIRLTDAAGAIIPGSTDLEPAGTAVIAYCCAP